MAVWEALALARADAETAVDGSPLIGRDDEVAFLRSQWQRTTRDGRPHVALLCGEAGSGKTRLLNELVRTVGSTATVVRSSYPAYGTLGGWQVATDIIGQLGPSDDAEVNIRLRSIGGEMDASLQDIDPAGLAHEQVWAFARLVQEKGASGGVMLIIDDMHHSGDRILDILGELAGRLNDVALLTVLAGRTEPGDWLTRFPAATTVRLGPLSRADAATLAGTLVCDKPLTAEASAFLVERANGNPLYLRELVAMARERGTLVDDGGAYQLTAPGAVPATLQAVLAARLDALDPGLKLGLQHVAVVGDAATVAQVAALGSVDAGSTLQALVELGLLRHGPDGRYDAVDPLLREVAYETLPHTLRGELHRQASAQVGTLEERARHLERAVEYLDDDESVTTDAIEALVAAGQACVQASRLLDALRLLDRAVALGGRQPSALLELAKLQASAGHQAAALDTLALIDDDPDDPVVAVERDHTAATSVMFSDPGTAIPGLQKAAQEWNALGRTAKEAWARANVGVALFNLSRMEESVIELEEALELVDRSDDQPGVIAVSAFLCLVKPADPRVPVWLAQTLEFADAAGDRSRQMNTLTTLAWNHFLRSFCGRPQDMA
ncbi:MAG: ATP-binding protein, partial [Acidimicrobiales bacterium]